MVNEFLDKTKIFSKRLWLQSALESKNKGIINQKEIDDACRIWVDNFDGKTVSEIEAMGEIELVQDRWLI